MSFLNFSMLGLLMWLVENTSWPRRRGNRTYSNFLNRILLSRSRIVEICKRMAFDPISIAASFNVVVAFRKITDFNFLFMKLLLFLCSAYPERLRDRAL